jgi:HNH endonuclease
MVPLSRGGSNWTENIQLLCVSCNDLLCVSCNDEKRAFTQEEYGAVLAYRALMADLDRAQTAYAKENDAFHRPSVTPQISEISRWNSALDRGDP